MKKIAIISELAMNNFNYGNRLQSFALNHYLNNHYKNYITESLVFSNGCKQKRTKITYQTFLNFFKKFKISSANNFSPYDFSKRIENSNEFTHKNTKLCPELLNYNLIQNTDYDVFIVGSDVVWAQFNRGVNKIKFLDFKNKKNFKRISYAASFGRDYIPKENKKYIIKALKKFNNISVREKSSVKMLNDLKIENVYHVCDPTLLISKDEWTNISKKINIKDKFIFVYMLGKDENQRSEIQKVANQLQLKIVTIPHADGNYNVVDETFGNYRLDNCSPEEWLYLIKNAEYIFTDSFHGIIFSCIFEKNFIALKRDYKENINNRLIDFLNTIDESDKYMLVPNYEKLSKISWNYKKINKKLQVFINESKNYLENALK